MFDFAVKCARTDQFHIRSVRDAAKVPEIRSDAVVAWWWYNLRRPTLIHMVLLYGVSKASEKIGSQLKLALWNGQQGAGFIGLVAVQQHARFQRLVVVVVVVVGHMLARKYFIGLKSSEFIHFSGCDKIALAL